MLVKTLLPIAEEQSVYFQEPQLSIPRENAGNGVQVS
jgi:hypothetical protein